MHHSKVIFEQISPINFHSAKNNSCNKLSMGDSLVMSNVILKCLNTCATTFPPIFKNTVVSRDGIGNLMKEYAEKEGIMPQPRRMLISSFILTDGTIITPLLLFYLKLGLFVERFTGLFNTLPESASTVSYSLPWMHDDKEIKIQIPVLLPIL